MRRILFGVILLGMMLVVSDVMAQPISVDINRAKLQWSWTMLAGSSPIVDFEMRCGQTPKNYTKMTVVGPTITSMDIKDAITGVGNWFCAVAARNQFGTLVSGEVPFVAGSAPSGTLTLIIVAQ